jgi:hypothetical protein
MKQLFSLFLFLLPCLAWAQYPSNGNQKITLGEQTTADGLIWRGVAADTTLTAKSDTAAYLVLDTVNLNLYTYKASATGRKWRQLGADTASIAYVNTYGTQTVGGAKTFTTGIKSIKNIDGDAENLFLSNNNAGTSTETTLYVSNNNLTNGSIFFQTTGENFSSVGGFLNDQGTIGTGTTISNGMALMVRAAADMRFYTSGHTNERMRIKSDGKVGIGTDGPTEKLHVVGNGLFTGNLSLGTPLAVANGGTGSATQNFVDLTTTQSSIGGKKTFTSGIATTANINGDPEGFTLTNTSTGSSAESTLYVRNESNNNASIFFSTSGTNLSPIGGFLADQGTIGTGTTISNGMALMVRAAANMRFYTSDYTNERMRIESGGEVNIGYGATDNGAYKLQVNSQIFATSGTIATSDGNYKENIEPLIDALNIVNSLNPISFNWKSHPTHNFDLKNKTVGFIAQEVQEVLKDKPYVNSIVKQNQTTYYNENDEEINEPFLGIAEGNLIAILTRAIQEQQEQINTLKLEVEQLKTMVQ